MKTIVFAILLSCLLVSCGYGSGKITLESNSAPLTFKLHGSDELQWIWITGPYQNEREPAPKIPASDDPMKMMVWRIAPSGEFPPMNEIPLITYGQLPNGWRQEIPEAGSPPPLLDGYVYNIRAIPLRHPPTVLCVYVKGGQLQPYTEEMPSSPCK